MAIRRTQVTVVGNTTGKTPYPIDGAILAVHLDYSASAHADTDVTIAESTAPALPVLTKSNNNTDGWFYPRVTVHGVSDGAAITGPVDYQSVGDHLAVTVAQNTDGQTVTATIVWDDLKS